MSHSALALDLLASSVTIDQFVRFSTVPVEQLWDDAHPYRPCERTNSNPIMAELKAEINEYLKTILENLGYSRKTSLIVPPLPTFAAVKREATLRSHNIFNSWNQLHNILLHHEETLRKRWLKKSVAQRKRVLLEAWPDMAVKHRPDFQILGKNTLNGDPLSNHVFRKEFLFPYVNLEDLTKPNNLLLFLNSRGHNRPDVFAFFDLKTQHTGRAIKVIQPAYLHGHSMLLINQTTPETYGTLIPWGADCKGFWPLVNGLMAQPGEGLLALEVQETILKFLLRCSQDILRDLLPLPASMETLPAPLPPPSTIQNGAEWSSVAAVVAEAPYRVPVHQLDFERLIALVSAKFSEAEDHIWSLREDPSYFQDYVAQHGDHQHENLRDWKTGKLHSNLGSPAFWAKLQCFVVVKAYSDLLLWNVALKEVTRLATLRAKYGDRIHPSRKLPEKYAEELNNFICYVTIHLRSVVLESFYKITPCSPPLRDRYYRKKVTDPNDPIQYDIGIKNVLKMDYFTLILDFFTNAKKMVKLGFSELLDELDRITRSNSSGTRGGQNDLISPLVAASLSDLAVVSEIERQLNWHQPRINPVGDDHEGAARRLQKQEMLYNKFFEATDNFKLEASVFDLGLAMTKFNYPSAKRMTAATVNRMREAEMHLDEFWRVIDAHYVETLGEPLHSYMLKLGLMTVREIERTPEWIEPTVVVKPENNVPAITVAFSDLNIEEHPVPDAPPVKVKVKTRGSPHGEIDVVAELIIPAPPPPTETITVNKRAYKVFSSIFCVPSAAVLPGEILWTEFLYALSSAGFAIEKQHGSAWLFSPSGPAKRPIMFHEPHPSSRVPIQIARRFGRRLKYAYGWTIDTFVLED